MKTRKVITKRTVAIITTLLLVLATIPGGYLLKVGALIQEVVPVRLGILFM